MQVKTYNYPLLLADVERLATQIKVSGKYPTYIISVREGGAYLGDLLRQHFPEVPYEAVQLQRSLGVKKNNLSQWLIKKLPRKVCNWLRMLEMQLRDRKSVSASMQDIRIEDLKVTPVLGKRILLVDDAIDSGATILAVRKIIKQYCPEADINIAVFTVTSTHPACQADFCLYHNRTLCRFPWSIDY